MNVTLFKQQLKQIVKANPQPIKFTILGMGNLEIYNSKKEFGLRLLEIFEDERFGEIFLSFMKEYGYESRRMSMSYLLELNHLSVEELNFHINTAEILELEKQRNKNMTSEMRAVREFGINS